MWKFWLNKGGLPCKSALWLFSEPFRVLWSYGCYGYYGVLQKLLWFHCGPVWPSIIISSFRRKQICAAEERGTNRGCVSGTQTINYSSESQEAVSEKRMFSKKHHRWNRRVRKNEGWARWHCLLKWKSRVCSRNKRGCERRMSLPSWGFSSLPEWKGFLLMRTVRGLREG